MLKSSYFESLGDCVTAYLLFRCRNVKHRIVRYHWAVVHWQSADGSAPLT